MVLFAVVTSCTDAVADNQKAVVKKLRQNICFESINTSSDGTEEALTLDSLKSALNFHRRWEHML